MQFECGEYNFDHHFAYHAVKSNGGRNISIQVFWQYLANQKVQIVSNLLGLMTFTSIEPTAQVILLVQTHFLQL